MPSWKATLSKDDITDVIAYVRTLPLSDGPR
jgi:mono/diheme cytochrome c family protein